jgi:hypothetical protein
MEHGIGQRFEMSEAIRLAWTRLWSNAVPMLVFAALTMLVNSVMPVLQDAVGGFGAVALAILSFVVSALIAIGWIKLALDITDEQPVSSQAVIERFGLLVHYLVASILMTVMVLVGFVLFIVPGIIMILVFGFYGFHMVDTGERSPIAALRASAQITRGERLHLFGLGLALLVLNLLGLAVFVVGVLVTAALSLLTVAHVYRRLSDTVARDDRTV